MRNLLWRWTRRRWRWHRAVTRSACHRGRVGAGRVRVGHRALANQHIGDLAKRVRDGVLQFLAAVAPRVAVTQFDRFVGRAGNGLR